jgi:hypothetical protein
MNRFFNALHTPKATRAIPLFYKDMAHIIVFVSPIPTPALSVSGSKGIISACFDYRHPVDGNLVHYPPKSNVFDLIRFGFIAGLTAECINRRIKKNA